MPAAAVLLCPWVDLEGETQRSAGDEQPVLFSPGQARRLARAYLGGQPADDPVLSPLHTDLAGRPPLLIQAASGDAALPDARLLAQHGQDCGVRTTISVFPVPTHDFHVFWTCLPEAMDALGQAGQFIRGSLPGTHPGQAPAAGERPGGGARVRAPGA